MSARLRAGLLLGIVVCQLVRVLRAHSTDVPAGECEHRWAFSDRSYDYFCSICRGRAS